MKGHHMKVAFVHDWLVTYRGGEKVLEQLIQLYPDAPIYTLFYKPDQLPESIRSRDIRYPKFLAPFWKVKTALLPWMPQIMEALPLEDYDLVISTSSCVAKGVIVGPHTRHLCYLHSPMRYIWDQRREYIDPLRKIPGAAAAIHALSTRLRMWDVVSSTRVDQFVVNSEFVRRRVQKYYSKDAVVVHPPVNWQSFAHPAAAAAVSARREPYFLTAGAFVSYKKLDIAIKACQRAQVKLVVAGSGQDEKYLRSLAGSDTEFVIRPSKDEWTALFRGAQAFLFPAVEDFGITAIEAMSSGVPVLAYRAGGALDFIQPGITGEFFDQQTEESLAGLLAAFDRSRYESAKIQAFAKSFDNDMFLSKMKHHIEALLRG
jgi:glycosyltransferase involved in cell wall biosynthesis